MTVQKKNILVIEDSEQYMDMICSKLSNITDINVYKAKDSAQAYKYALEENISVFIVDIILDTNALGDVSGIKFVERIRTIPEYKFTPIIITSSLEAYQVTQKSEITLLMQSSFIFSTIFKIDCPLYLFSS